MCLAHIHLYMYVQTFGRHLHQERNGILISDHYTYYVMYTVNIKFRFNNKIIVKVLPAQHYGRIGWSKHSNLLPSPLAISLVFNRYVDHFYHGVV